MRDGTDEPACYIRAIRKEAVVDDTAIVDVLLSRLRCADQEYQKLSAKLDGLERDRQSLERVLAMYGHRRIPVTAIIDGEGTLKESDFPGKNSDAKKMVGSQAVRNHRESPTSLSEEASPATRQLSRNTDVLTRKAEALLEGRSYQQLLEEYDEREPGRFIKLSPMLQELFGDTINRKEFRLLWNGLNNTLGRIVRRSGGWERVANRTGTYRRDGGYAVRFFWCAAGR